MPAEGRENPLLKKGNSDAFFREKYLTKNRKAYYIEQYYTPSIKCWKTRVTLSRHSEKM